MMIWATDDRNGKPQEYIASGSDRKWRTEIVSLFVLKCQFSIDFRRLFTSIKHAPKIEIGHSINAIFQQRELKSLLQIMSCNRCQPKCNRKLPYIANLAAPQMQLKEISRERTSHSPIYFIVHVFGNTFRSLHSYVFNNNTKNRTIYRNNKKSF